MRLIAALILIPALLVTGCANVGLRDLRSNSAGPDEFGISPVGRLEKPANYSELPTPTLGKSNVTDRAPLQDGAQAFGGRLADPNGPIPAGDGALVQHASRLGVTEGIRGQLAEADAKFRKRKARFTQIRIVPVDRYNEAYRREALNAQAERTRWQRAGARTPSAPPAN